MHQMEKRHCMASVWQFNKIKPVKRKLKVVVEIAAH